MISLGDFVDPYVLRARIFPAVLCLLAPVAGGLLLGAVTVPLDWDAGVYLLAVLAVIYFLAGQARRAGLRCQEDLVVDWGGMPTTIMLRHSDATLDRETKRRIHAYLGERIGRLCPTPEEEAELKDEADAVYVSATAWLRNNRRGEEHKILHGENAEYGFRRNMRGIRWWSIGLSVLVIVAAAIKLLAIAVIHESWNVEGIREHTDLIADVLAVTINAISIGGFLWVPTVTWVRQAADKYAKTLLETCDTPER